MNKLLAITIALAHLAVRAEAFAPTISNRISTHRRSTMTMYFDDISRKSQQIPWTPKHNQIRYASRPQSKITSTDYSSEKLDMLQAVLHGHDAASAGRLTVAEVKEAANQWMEGACFANDFLFVAEVDFECSVFVNNSTSVAGCCSYLWDHIANRAKHASGNETHEGSPAKNSIEMIVFPNCPKMYNYETMRRVTQDIIACCDICNTFGTEFAVSAFHPHYEFEPRMLSPERHSPFPCFGIHAAMEVDDDDEIMKVSFLGLDVGNSATDSDRDTAELDSLRSDMRNMDTNRDKLEALFNSGASSIIDLPKATVCNEVFDEYFISATQDWMRDNSKEYSTTIGDRWEISNSIMEESIYAEIWSLIHHLEAHLQSSQDTDTVSAMFIATNFSLYNAQKFKRLAITVNKMLKKSNANISMEMFHPEYVGKTEKGCQIRRSPFPSLHFIIISKH